jgi:hypothetical protein
MPGMPHPPTEHNVLFWEFGAPYPIQVSTAFVGYVKALESAHTQGDSFRARKKKMTMTILLNGTHSIS